MQTVLFLTCRMKLGFGVDVVVHQLGAELTARGYRVVVGAQDIEGDFPGIEVARVDATAESVALLARRVQPSVVVAHSSPFFELLPALQRQYRCWAYEHGDPSAAFFSADADERRRICDNKTRNVYPRIAGVVAISEFIRQDIGFAEAEIIYSGCDHAPRVASKSAQDILPGERRPLRIGTLMRLGAGEAHYKGNAYFRDICAAITADGIATEPWVMGRGTPDDAAPFEALGIRAHLNASAAQKWRYLRELDIFITPSLWEGFNLPLVEAQAMGTLGIALDTGAHPEVTPFVAGGIADIVALVRSCDDDRALLLEHSTLCWRFARNRFRWSQTADAFERIVICGERRAAA